MLRGASFAVILFRMLTMVETVFALTQLNGRTLVVGNSIYQLQAVELDPIAQAFFNTFGLFWSFVIEAAVLNSFLAAMFMICHHFWNHPLKMHDELVQIFAVAVFITFVWVALDFAVDTLQILQAASQFRILTGS
jgi:hypothetical protein